MGMPDHIDDLLGLALASNDLYIEAAVHSWASADCRQQLEALMFAKRRNALLLAKWEHTPASVLEALSQRVVSTNVDVVDTSVAMRLDKNPNTSAQVLTQLYAGQRKLKPLYADFMLLIAQHAHTPASVLQRIAQASEDDACLKAVSRNQAAGADVLAGLLKRMAGKPLMADLAKNMAENPSTSATLLQAIYVQASVHVLDVYVRAAVIAHASCLQSLIDAAVHDDDVLVMRKLAASKKVSPDALFKLARSVDVAVRCAVASNPLSPKRLVRMLLHDENHLVRRGIAARKDLGKASIYVLQHDEDRWVRQWLARNGVTPPSVLEALVLDPDADVRRAVARNTGCTLKLLQLLANDSSAWVRSAVAYQHKTPKSVLAILATDTDIDVLSGVANNPRTPQRILQGLTASTEADVRRGVILNKKASRKTLLPLLEDPYYLHRLLLVGNDKLQALDKWRLHDDPDSQVRFTVFKWMANRVCL